MARKIDFAMSTEDIEHEIQEGDTVDSICKRYSTSLKFILDKNNLTEQQLVDLLTTGVGSFITIPMLGDLMLGGEKRDSSGKLLYVYKNGTVSTSPQINGEEGKMIRDLSYVRDRDAVKQIVMNRLTTDAPDWFHHRTMGGNLSDLIGEPNTRETAERGAAYIVAALTYENLFTRSQVLVRPVPLNEADIMFMITIYLDDNTTFRLPLVFNLQHGLKEVQE